MVKKSQQHCKVKVKLPDGKAFMYNTDIAVSIGCKVSGKMQRYWRRGVFWEGLEQFVIYVLCGGCIKWRQVGNTKNVCMSDMNVTDGVLIFYKGNDIVIVAPRMVKTVGKNAFKCNVKI